MASLTVRIFSASSSGISRSNASSNAMTSSTVSSESAPRSSTKEAFGVTSPSSTPSCSTMICFTFSSTAVGICLSLLLVSSYPSPPDRSLLHRLRVLLDIVHGVLHGHNFFRVRVGNFQIESFFERHHQLHAVQRVRPQVFDKGCGWCDRRGLHV